jgi:hypothetical protein
VRTTDDAWRPFSTLQGFVRLVLLIDWDPIGVLGYSGAMDEYDRYADDICRLIHTGASRELLIAHLDKIEKQRMGLRGERRTQTEVAEKLLAIYEAIRQDERWRTED